jgi:hypothetical protein
MDTTKRDGDDLPPVPGPDTWSAGEAADWDPDHSPPEGSPADTGAGE